MLTIVLNRHRDTSACAHLSHRPDGKHSRPERAVSSAPIAHIGIATMLISAWMGAAAAAQSIPVSVNARNSISVRRHVAANVPLTLAHVVPAVYSGFALSSDAEPLTLASADFDGDGVPDLVAGYATTGGGKIAIHRGNVNALWPYGAAARSGPPPEFLPDARVFALPAAPDFVATGDFDADGHWDVITAQRGGSALYFLRGDGQGGFATPQSTPLPGKITALAVGDVNRPDGLADLVVALDSAGGAKVLVFEGPNGAVKAAPESFPMPVAVTGLAVAKIDCGWMNDVVVAAGSELIIIHTRDRRLSLGMEQRAAVPAAKVSLHHLPYAVQALAVGDFADAGPSIAALGDDGRLHILEHAIPPDILKTSWLGKPDFQPKLELHGAGREGKPVILGGRLTPDQQHRISAARQTAKESLAQSAEWLERSTVALPQGFSQKAPSLVAGRVTASVTEDVVVVDSGSSKVHIFSTSASPHDASTSDAALTRHPAMRLLASVDASRAPAAILPMRLNQHGWQGLVFLEEGDPEVRAMGADPDNVYTVTNTQDAAPPLIPMGSLRDANTQLNTVANAAIGTTPTANIVFNIPSTDPGCNSTTGVCLIQPVAEDPAHQT